MKLLRTSTWGTDCCYKSEVWVIHCIDTEDTEQITVIIIQRNNLRFKIKHTFLDAVIFQPLHPIAVNVAGAQHKIMVKYLLLTLFFLGLCIRLSPGINNFEFNECSVSVSSYVFIDVL